ncbi:MAG TPA: gephyrin-like molybdotransferase Glp [Chloroflexota bacterium]|nr:gephyrin-like molybdotransferase Glp [Chloroflexota bacterium]
MSTTRELFNVRTPPDALSVLLDHVPARVEMEEVPTVEALDRVLAADVHSPSDLPTFRRSTMDGFAVRAADTFGATEGLPAYLDIVDEVFMGHAPTRGLGTGQCARIATGGMLPENADAVVMVEQTQEVGPTTIEALRAVAPGENVVQIGEDVRTGDPILAAGHRLRPQDLGGLVALGITSVRVARRLRVGIVSGGDELVAPSEEPGRGQIRDINSYTLAAMIRRDGHVPCLAGIFPDEYAALDSAARTALAANDVVILSAGSSVSARDMTAQVVDSLGKPGVLVHGVSLKPGKPTILAVCDGKPVFGLPGNPVSCMVTYDLFVAPTLARLCGATSPPRTSVTARLTRNIASATGREDYIQVRLERRQDGGFDAVPVFGKSNLIFTLIRADGMLKIPLDAGGLPAGVQVDVVLF